MSITLGSISLDFFCFFDFKAGFRAPAGFEAWEPHLKPAVGITMMNPRHLNTRRCCNFDWISENIIRDTQINSISTLWRNIGNEDRY